VDPLHAFVRDRFASLHERIACANVSGQTDDQCLPPSSLVSRWDASVEQAIAALPSISPSDESTFTTGTAQVNEWMVEPRAGFRLEVPVRLGALAEKAGEQQPEA
jgi:hypothetical protein